MFGPQLSLRLSLDSSYVKNQFLGPSRGWCKSTPVGPSFPFFHTFFVSRVLFSFVLLCYIVHFVHFVVHVLHFVDFVNVVSLFCFSCCVSV